MGTMCDHQESEHFAYDKSWEDIERMLKKAEAKQNYWISEFYFARSLNDRKRMKDAARNKKALEGVIKTLRWTLGDKNVSHPLE
jgi:hypothetical protein